MSTFGLIDHNMTVCGKCGEPKADHYRVAYANDGHAGDEIEWSELFLICKLGHEIVEVALEEYAFREAEYAR